MKFVLNLFIYCSLFIGKKRIPFQKPSFYGIGDENEAKYYAIIAGDTWRKDKYAVDVLKKLYKK